MKYKQTNTEMKKVFTKQKIKNTILKKGLVAGALFLLFSFLCPLGAWAQNSNKAFKPRTSIYSPGTQVYHIQGDYQIIGNTNLTLRGATPQCEGTNNTTNNNATMVYVDVDDDASTVNSSMAQLKFSQEQGANPECTHIVYAGLYWTGKKNSNNTSSDGMDYTVPGNGKTLHKNVVEFKHQNGTYQTITANTSDINYPSGDSYNIYVAYAEVTDIVQEYGEGNYYVADVCCAAGDGGMTGFSGGWGLVVIYENSMMKWRDITVFDGYTYVDGSNHPTINIEGFKTVQVGHVNMKLGVMASEGDYNIAGDYAQIKTVAGGYVRLDHDGTVSSSTSGNYNNFWRSVSNMGDIERNPKYCNNVGIDLSMINLENKNNTILANEQTSTSFQFGSSQDIYIPFCFVFGCDAYIPNVRVVDAVVESEQAVYDPVRDIWVVEPGDSVTFTMKVHNYDNEDVENATVRLPLPATLRCYSVDAQYAEGRTGNFHLDPTQGVNGTAVWTLDYIPAGEPDSVWATFTLKCQITDDCYVLAANRDDCLLKIVVNGTLEGTSVFEHVPFYNDFIQGFQQSGVCNGYVIAEDLTVLVDRENYLRDHCNCTEISGEYDNSCFTIRAVNYCKHEHDPIPFEFVSQYYPLGTRFFNLTKTVEYNITTGFPDTCWGQKLIVVTPASEGTACESNVIVEGVSRTKFADPTALTVVPNVYYCVGDTSKSLKDVVTLGESSVDSLADPFVAFYATNPTTNSDAPASSDCYPSTDTAGSHTFYAVQYQAGNPCYASEPQPITVTVSEMVHITASAESPSCAGTAVTFTPDTGGGRFEIPDSIATYVTVNEGIATIAANAPAGTYSFTYYAPEGMSAIAPCGPSSLSRPITHTITPASVGGTINSPTICSGSPIPTLTLSGYTGHVERWEYKKSSETSWTTISNNTDHITQTDIEELSEGIYEFRAVLKSGTCASVNSSGGTVTVSSTSAPTDPAILQPQYFCVGDSFHLNPTGDNYRWYELEEGGDPADSLREGKMGVEWVRRYVSNYNSTTGCESHRVLVEARPRFSAGAIVGGSQLSCSTVSTATKIESKTNAQVNDGSATVLQYQWYVSTNGGAYQLITGANTATYTPTAYLDNNGIYVFVRKVKYPGCDSVLTSNGTWTLSVGKPDATIAADPNNAKICGSEDSVKLSLPAVTPASDFKYQWYKNGTPIPGATSPTYAATTAGTYTASVEHLVSGCSAISNADQDVEVTVYPKPTVTAADASVVYGNSTTLTASGASSYTWEPSTYLGTPNAASTSFSGANVGDLTYKVIGVNSYGCKDTATIKVTTTKRPITIKAEDASKYFDGLPLTKNAWTRDPSTPLATGDVIDTVVVTGTITNAGTAPNVPSDAVITHNADTVTKNYDITYVNGTLTVLKTATGMKDVYDTLYCNKASFSVVPTGTYIPEGTQYKWTVDASPVMGQSAQATPVDAPISQLLENTGNVRRTIAYEVVPVTEGAAGDTFKIYVTVYPTEDLGLVCPPDVERTLEFGEDAKTIAPAVIGTPTWTHVEGWSETLSSDKPLDNVYPAGDNIITWVLTGKCSYTDTCKQHVVIKYPDCPVAVDNEGNNYVGVRIGSKCWTQSNLISKKYSDGTDIPGVHKYYSDVYPDVNDNIAKFGLLYDWASAINGGTEDSHGYIQGVCPAGWHLPTAEDYESLNQQGADALKSPLYWLDGGGNNSTGFSSLPGGYYEGSIDRYINLMGEAYYWSTTKDHGTWHPSGFVVKHDCDMIIESSIREGLGFSVRCVK